MRHLLLVALAAVLGLALIGTAGAQDALPAAPSDLVASSVSNQPDVWLSWHHSGASDDSFRIERSNYGENGPWDLVIEASSMCELPDATNCAYLDRTLQRQTTYWYRIATVNSAGASPYSNVASVHIPPQPAPGPGEIRGVVFHDRNNNGAHDAGEEGLQGRTVAISQDGIPVVTVPTDAAGEYVSGGLAPGAYTVGAKVDGHQGLCSLGAQSYNPFPSAFCVGPTYPWHNTSPSEVSVTVSDAAGAIADFGARPADVAVIEGLALLEDDFAPTGTEIQALVNGQVCGTATMPSSEGGYRGDHMFDLHILGAAEQPGCARHGDAVQFRVGGVPAAESISWAPFSDASTLQFQFLFLTAMQQHAWYWYQVSGDDRPADRTLVQAVIDGTVCGEAVVEQRSGIAGFSKLLVASTELQPGCGRSGAMVSFVFDGAPVGDPIEWRPGLQTISDLAPVLPPTGAGRDRAPDWPLGALAAAGVLTLCLGLAGASRRGRRRDPQP